MYNVFHSIILSSALQLTSLYSSIQTHTNPQDQSDNYEDYYDKNQGHHGKIQPEMGICMLLSIPKYSVLIMTIRYLHEEGYFATFNRIDEMMTVITASIQKIAPAMFSPRSVSNNLGSTACMKKECIYAYVCALTFSSSELLLYLNC